MKHISRHRPILTLIAAMVLAPLLYVYTLHWVERHFTAKVQAEIEGWAIGDGGALLAGSLSLQDALKRNIGAYLAGRFWLRHGLEVQVTVVTRTGRLLYPGAYEAISEAVQTPDPREVASENYALLNDGLVFTTNLHLRQPSLIANTVLGAYLALAVLLVLGAYRAFLSRLRTGEKEKAEAIEKLSETSRGLEERLHALDSERKRLELEFERVRSDLLKEKASAIKNEDEMLEEIERLEGLLRENTRMQQAQQAELAAERERIEAFEKERAREEEKRLKESEAAMKRFNALYKNLAISGRAVEGFVALPEEQRIKAEEVIHQLNEDPAQVPVKRKVFSGKKSRDTVIEVDFAYSGRLYFRHTGERGVEVIAIGNKNTQARDMAFVKSGG